MRDEDAQVYSFFIKLAISGLVGIVCGETLKYFTEHGITIGIGVGFILLIILMIIAEIKGRKTKKGKME